MKRRINNEEGQALPLAIIALSIGSLLVGGFLSYMSTNLIASGTFSRLITGQYSADAGAEDAIWNLMYGDLATNLASSGDSVTYSLTEAVNGFTPEVTVTRDKVNIASDDFESGGWSGGSGWLDGWYYQGDADIVKSGTPYEGSYHLRLMSNTGYVKRAIDLSARAGDSLEFWAKASSFETGEEAQCLVSSNGSDWTPVETWLYGDDDVDDEYHFYSIDLSPYTPSSEFWIAFQAGMSAANDYFYVDDLKVINILPGAALGLPSDDFESGDWSGGSGWLADWSYVGSCEVTDSNQPYEGSYHLKMFEGDSYVRRDMDLSGESGLRLQFWAKTDSFKGGDYECRVSPNSTEWTTVKTWTGDNAYHFVDIDISPYTMSSQFWVEFRTAAGNDNKDYLYIDELMIVGAIAYEIVSNADSGAVTSTVVIQESELTILSWQIE